MARFAQSVLLAGILMWTATVAVAAADQEIRVVKVQGKVEVIDAQGNVKEAAKPDSPLAPGETIRTAEGSRAAVRNNLGDTYILDAASAAKVKTEKNAMEQLIGKIMYLFTPGLRAERSVQVQTAVIGIRGTTFLVDAKSDSASVGLREGALDVTSTGAGFNVYQRKELDDFEAFKQRDLEKVKEMKKEFEQYRAQVREEFVAFKKSLQLKPNQSLSIAGDKAVVSGLDPEAMAIMQDLEKFVSDIPSGN